VVSASPWKPTNDEAWEWTASLRVPVSGPNFVMLASLQRALLQEGRNSVMTGLGGDDAFVERSRKSRVASAVRHRQLRVLATAVMSDVRHPRSAWTDTWRGVVGYYIPWRRQREAPTPISPAAARATGLDEIVRQPVQRLTGDRAVDERASGLTSGYVAAILEEAAIVEDLTGCRSTHPFLDPRFITATYGLNPWFPTRLEHDRALEVAAYDDRLPAEVRDRRSKAEFSEVTRWSESDDADIERDLLTGPLKDRGWIDAASLAALIAATREGQQGVGRLVARARSLDRWLRTLS
jgi:hypothetical protein